MDHRTSFVFPSLDVKAWQIFLLTKLEEFLSVDTAIMARVSVVPKYNPQTEDSAGKTQRIHCRYVPSPGELLIILKRTYGDEGFYVEVCLSTIACTHQLRVQPRWGTTFILSPGNQEMNWTWYGKPWAAKQSITKWLDAEDFIMRGWVRLLQCLGSKSCFWKALTTFAAHPGMSRSVLINHPSSGEDTHICSQ